MNSPSHLTPPSPHLQRELVDLAIELAGGAAGLIRRRVQARGDAELFLTSKSTPTDVVTEVDQEVEAWLVSQLHRRRPGDRILAEEGGRSDGEGPEGASEPALVRWVIDPIDGTVNFVRSLPRYAVSIAVEINGVTEAGCVHNPMTGDLYWAVRGGGAWWRQSGQRERRLRGPARRELALAVVATGFSYDAQRRSRQVAVVAGLITEVADIRRMGAASLDLCSLAAGEVDAYYESGLSPWDYGAGVLIAAEAGCSVSGLRGRDCSSVMTAAGGATLAADFFRLLERLGADTV